MDEAATTPDARTDAPPCVWCGKPAAEAGKRGTRPKYCGQTCRQRAYEARRERRRTAAALGLLADSDPVERAEHAAAALADAARVLLEIACTPPGLPHPVALSAAESTGILEALLRVTTGRPPTVPARTTAP
ncbi:MULTISPECIES: hypothetical protein [Kitasatospora]|uniref:Uncharacterized protein n=1 Tax=Kitasatospora setae (strain ATCC 33774 / DSM 43861 / JCM 3304 / KCC A-0304 / NBRC 14216 / KM-6054) TaxID=452652 RepID=E4NJE7_KITSK|nr:MULTISPECIES: hypothetical protein [Kitasatospora]BAJ33095.1 hypothetical protein KSE_73400 [Kitasatospora setae KM-6054]